MNPPAPMLAHKYGEKTMPLPCYVQPKLDGVRCLTYLDDDALTCVSRNGKPLHIPPCINALPDDVLALLAEGMVLDGELYVHKAGFSSIVSLVKRKDHVDNARLEYHIYDCFFPDHALSLESFSNRWGRLEGQVAPALREACLDSVRTITTIKVHTQEGLDSFHWQQVGLGYEGTILRRADGPYQQKRSAYLLKRKDFLDKEYHVVDVLEGEGKNAGTAVLKCAAINGSGGTFTATAPGTYEEKAEVWRNRTFYVGKKVTIKYQELTDDGIPRFPIATGFPVDR